MKTLFCAIVRVQGSGFSVDIATSKSVHLEKAIKKENEDIACPPHELQLFLAKKDDAWVDEDGVEAVALDENWHPQDFGQMDPFLWIKNV